MKRNHKIEQNIIKKDIITMQTGGNEISESNEINKLRDRLRKLDYLLNEKDKQINDLNFKITELESKNNELIQTLKEQEKIVEELNHNLKIRNELLSINENDQQISFSEKAKNQRDFYDRNGNSSFGSMLQKNQLKKKRFLKKKKNSDK